MTVSMKLNFLYISNIYVKKQHFHIVKRIFTAMLCNRPFLMMVFLYPLKFSCYFLLHYSFTKNNFLCCMELGFVYCNLTWETYGIGLIFVTLLEMFWIYFWNICCLFCYLNEVTLMSWFQMLSRCRINSSAVYWIVYSIYTLPT